MKEANNNPQEAFQQAEALRKESQPAEAKKHYQQAIQLANERTQIRGNSRVQRAASARRKLRTKLYLFALIPVVLAVAGFSLFKTVESEFERKKAATDPKSFTFIEWLVRQQASEVMNNIVAANPELSFDLNRSTSAMNPAEALQSMMGAGMQDRIRQLSEQRESGAPAAEGEAGDGSPTFKCSVDRLQQCSADASPTAPGAEREDISLLVRSYRTVLNNEKDCSKIVDAIGSLGKKLQWRRSEKDVKAELEHLALSCYARTKDHQKTIEQARRLQCSGSTSAMNTSYWYLTASHAHLGETDQAARMYTCFKQTIDHLTRYEFSASSIASRRRESGALAWLYFNDLDTAVSELEAARGILKRARMGSQQLSFVASEIDLDLMETYVTANINPQTFAALHEDINTSGLLTDGYKQIKDTLAGIYYLQNSKNQEAIIALNNVATRFKHLPEYICSWDWSGFQRGLADSIKDPIARQKADQLVVATNCYVPQSIEERIQKVNEVLQWLRQ
ncbi:MAG: hypothetical protein ACPG47_05950 [Leucothrix sp.]